MIPIVNISAARLKLSRSLAVILVFGMAATATAQVGNTASLSAQSDIFRAGGNAPTLDGIDPFVLTITATGIGRIATFGASGSWNCCNGSGAFQGPDGGFTGNPSTNINSWNSIAGIGGPLNMWLVGVFLDDGLPASTPPARSYSDYSALAYDDILLGQVFFIGDGLTGAGTGTVQDFLVPDGATRLYFGLVDGASFQGDPGAYADNVGSLAVNWDIANGQPIAVTPEPATMTLLAIGLLGVVLARDVRARRQTAMKSEY